MKKRITPTAAAPSLAAQGTPAKSMLTTDERIRMLFVQPPETLARIDAIMQGEDAVSGKPEPEYRTVTYTEAARRMNVSRPTIYRLVKCGRLKVVPLMGVNRIVLSSIDNYVNAGRC